MTDSGTVDVNGAAAPTVLIDHRSFRAKRVNTDVMTAIADNA